MAEKRKQASILSFLKQRKIETDDFSLSSQTGSTSNTSQDSEACDCEQFKGNTIASDPSDIATALGKVLSHEEKYRFLKEKWIPPLNFDFPMQIEGGQKRKFQRKWLSDYPWLAYSQSQGGAFCVPCVLFGPVESGSKHAVPLGALVTTPLKNFKKALDAFKSHSFTNYHKMALLRSSNYSATNDNPTMAINILLDTEKHKRILKNRERLLPIVKTVIFCGQENIPLRGHRDDGDLSETNAKSEGKFRALLKFRIDSGDTVLKQHLDTAPKNASFISKTTQNQIIECCHSIITKKIVDNIKKAKYFSVLADETTDVSTTEQLSVCVRYLDTESSILKEKFLCFVPATDVNGAALTDLILQELKKLGLQIENLRGQGYDGGSNMAGKFRGVQARIKELQPLAIYMHCSSHKLNLCISKSCCVQSIRNMMGTVKNVANFVHESCKRTELMKLTIKETHPEEKRVKIKTLSDTRWIERHDALLQFHDLFDAIISFLESADHVTPSANSAGLLAAISRFDFLMALTITSNVFQLTISLSRQLQAVELDLKTCYSMVERVIEILKQYRDGFEKYEDIFNDASRIAESQSIPIQAPRLAKKQTHRSNVDAPNVKEYYRLNVFLPFLDHMISELSARFSKKEHSHILDLFSLIPSNFSDSDVNLSEVVKAAEIYEKDLPSPLSIKGEITLWREYWTAKNGNIPTTAAAAHCEAKDFFPNIKVLLQILATIPVTTCSVERSFSTLKLIKTYLRATMGAERLNGLASLYIHRSILITPEEVVEEYARMYPRRLELLYEKEEN